MVATIFQAAQNNASTANTDEYWYLVGGCNKRSGEASAGLLMRSAGNFKNLFCKLSANSVAATSTFTLRKNATTDGTNVISVGSNATGDFEDATPHTDAVAAGDKWCLKTHPGASSGTYTMSIVSILFEATTNSVSLFANSGTPIYSTASTSFYLPLTSNESGTNPALAEATCKINIRKNGTFKYLGVNVSSNRAQATTVTLHKNGSGTGINNTISVTGGGATGWYEDTSHSDTVTAGEDWNYVITTGTGVDNFRLDSIKVEFESTVGDGVMAASVPSAPIAITDGTNRFFYLGGKLVAFSGETGATGCQTKARVAFTASELTCLITQNDVNSGSIVCRFRVDAGNSTLVASITANTTGVFSDSTAGHNVAVTAANLINYQIVVPAVASTHTVTVANISICSNIVVLTAVAQTYTHLYNIKNLVNKTYTHKWNIRNLVAQTYTHKWNIRNLIGQTFTHIYNILPLRVSQVYTHKWNIRNLANQTYTHKWNIRNLISKTFTHKWNIKNLVNKTFTHKWNIKNLAAQTFTHKYNIINFVNQTFTHLYNIKNLTSQTYTHKWNILTLIAQTFTHKYNIANLASQTFTHKYNIINFVSQTFTHIYNILGLGAVSRSYTHRYNIANLANQTYTHKYNIANLVSQIFTHKWNIRNLANQVFTHKYNIRNLATQLFTHRYDIRNLVAQTFTHLYNILTVGLVSASYTHKYNIRNLASKTYTHRWNILQIINQTFTHRYNILMTVYQLFTHRYNIRNLVSQIFTHLYNIIELGHVSNTFTHKYNIKNLVSKTFTHRYDIHGVAATLLGKLRDYLFNQYSSNNPSKQ